MDGKSIGKGLFAGTTHDLEQVIFQSGEHMVDYVGEIVTGPCCIGGEESDSEDRFDTPLVDCAFTRGVAALANY